MASAGGSRRSRSRNSSRGRTRSYSTRPVRNRGVRPSRSPWIDRPRFNQFSPTGPLTSDHPEVVSVELDEMRESDVSEMWLHVRTREGIWRRYPMVIQAAPGGVVGTAVFPVSVLDGRGGAL